jgi:hypothetical protein
MAFYGGFTPPPMPQPVAFPCRVVLREVYCAPKPADVSLLLPQSRAPPAVLPS